MDGAQTLLLLSDGAERRECEAAPVVQSHTHWILTWEANTQQVTGKKEEEETVVVAADLVGVVVVVLVVDVDVDVVAVAVVGCVDLPLPPLVLPGVSHHHHRHCKAAEATVGTDVARNHLLAAP